MKFVYLWSFIINMSFPALELHSELTLRKDQSYKNFKKCSNVQVVKNVIFVENTIL